MSELARELDIHIIAGRCREEGIALLRVVRLERTTAMLATLKAAEWCVWSAPRQGLLSGAFVGATHCVLRP